MINKKPKKKNQNFVGNPVTLGDRMADKVAATVGSWKFVGIQSFIIFCWVVWNTQAPENLRFDPYPFVFLNLTLSFQAAYTAPIIMMSQNRHDEMVRAEAREDYEINKKAELEVLDMQKDFEVIKQKLDLISSKIR